MKVSMLTETLATQTLLRLVQNCIQFDAAVAWAGSNTVVEAMLEAHPKLGQVVIGTHMYQTDPAVLRAFMPCTGARCLPPDGRLFHPKIYLFKTSQGFAAVVGSHNLTGGAFGGHNIEVSVLLEGDKSDEVFDQLASFIDSSWRLAKSIDEDDFLFAYEAQYQVNRAKLNELGKFHRLNKPHPGAKTSPINLTWDAFIEGVQSDSHHSLNGRLAVLERAGALFSLRRKLVSMTEFERKAIAGTYGSKEKRLDNLDWGWFGTMFGQGDFKNLINKAPEILSAALDHIPADGFVSEEQFINFKRHFDLAFQGKAHQGGVATASRLLAMKRPDMFVCVNNANRKGICKAFGSLPSTLSLINYWERILIPMQQSPWWLHARPRTLVAGRIWDNRAALMDSIYYEPTE